MDNVRQDERWEQTWMLADGCAPGVACKISASLCRW